LLLMSRRVERRALAGDMFGSAAPEEAWPPIGVFLLG